MPHQIDITIQHFKELELLKVGTISIDSRNARAYSLKDDVTLEVFDGIKYTGQKLFCSVNCIIPSQRYGVKHGQTTIGLVVNKSQRQNQ